jgi:hypothetical protein
MFGWGAMPRVRLSARDRFWAAAVVVVALAAFFFWVKADSADQRLARVCIDFGSMSPEEAVAAYRRMEPDTRDPAETYLKTHQALAFAMATSPMGRRYFWEERQRSVIEENCTSERYRTADLWEIRLLEHKRGMPASE